MPSGPPDSLTPATASGLAVAAPAGPDHAAPARTASPTLTPAHIACFRPRRDSLRVTTVLPPLFVAPKNESRLKRSNVDRIGNARFAAETLQTGEGAGQG